MLAILCCFVLHSLASIAFRIYDYHHRALLNCQKEAKKGKKKAEPKEGYTDQYKLLTGCLLQFDV